MGKNRLEAFSDGVVAIVVTIMALELQVQHDTSLAAPQPLYWIWILAARLHHISQVIYASSPPFGYCLTSALSSYWVPDRTEREVPSVHGWHLHRPTLGLANAHTADLSRIGHSHCREHEPAFLNAGGCHAYGDLPLTNLSRRFGSQISREASRKKSANKAPVFNGTSTLRLATCLLQ